MLAVALTLVLQQRLQRDASAFSRADGATPSAAARWLGAASVLLWVSALSLGRWIAYVLEA